MTGPHAPVAFNILVVDDGATIRRCAEPFVTQAGHQVMLADDDLDAPVTLPCDSPDLIFCGVPMPQPNGYRACALIKRNAEFHATPVIMLSSKGGLFDRARAAIAGASAFMTKPFSEVGWLQAAGSLRRCITGFLHPDKRTSLNGKWGFVCNEDQENTCRRRFAD